MKKKKNLKCDRILSNCHLFFFTHNLQYFWQNSHFIHYFTWAEFSKKLLKFIKHKAYKWKIFLIWKLKDFICPCFTHLWITVDWHTLFREVRTGKIRKKFPIDQSWFSFTPPWNLLKQLCILMHKQSTILLMTISQQSCSRTGKERLSPEPVIYKRGRMRCRLNSGDSIGCSDQRRWRSWY